MRIRRPLIVGALAAVMLFMPGCTLPIQQVSFGDASLGLQGASVTLPVSLTCQQGWNIAFGDFTVAQANGPRLAQGFGFFENDFPGVPCTGSAQSVAVNVFNTSPWVFTRGEAAASGTLTVFNPESGELISKSIDPVEIRIRRNDPQPNPSKADQPTRDPRYPKT